MPVQTNEADIGESRQSRELPIGDTRAVFAAVLDSLPERVNVLPTENYYYVRFVHKGVRYVGNIRLAAADRDQGKVHFSFSEEPADWNDEPADRHGALGPGEGVSVQKVAALEYRVSAGGRSVTFALNDLSRTVPPADHLAADETFLGPVFDESGIRFFFVFNTRLKVFHFLLDETEPVADELFLKPGVEPDRHRQAHRLCVLPVGQAEGPDRRPRKAIPAQHRSRWAVRPVARELLCR